MNLKDMYAFFAMAGLRKESPKNPMPWGGLQYHRAMASGAGKLKNIHNNLFTLVGHATVKQFLTSS
ncbi:MAG: hypothetical protein SH820_06645 [Xanthomonadales bacterium]|nr:hypothetical protein [Xanthomonadales bacterium]